MTDKEHQKILFCLQCRRKTIRQDKLDVATEYALRLYNDDQNERESLEAFQELQKEEAALNEIAHLLNLAGPAAPCWGEEIEND